MMSGLDIYAEIGEAREAYRNIMEELWGQLWGNHWACEAPNVFEDFMLFVEGLILDTGSTIPPAHWDTEIQERLETKLMDEFKEFFVEYVEYKAQI